jgi:hypothetical protein
MRVDPVQVEEQEPSIQVVVLDVGVAIEPEAVADDQIVGLVAR